MLQTPKRCRVAISDDSHYVRRVCEDILKYTPSVTGVLCVESRREFKKRIDELANCEILILDSFGLRDQGNSLAKIYAEKNKKGKIIRFYDSACINPETTLVGNYYLQKPFNVDRLMAVIWRAQNALGILNKGAVN